jgi:hypothetical protein
MPNISLTNYTPQMRDAERARQYAQMLQEQATAPIEQQTVNGNPVPIGWASVLAKGLQGYLGGRAARKADEREAATKAAMLKEAMGYISPENLNVEQAGSGLKQIGDVQFGNQGIVDRLKGMMPQGAPQPATSPVAAPAPQGMPIPMQQAPQAAMQGPVSAVVPKQEFAIPQELQDRTRSSEEKQRMLLAAALSDNPYLQKIAPSMYEEERNTAKAEKAFKVMGDLTDLGIDPKMMNVFKATGDTSGAANYLEKLGVNRENQKAALEAYQLKAEDTAKEHALQRDLQKSIADQASADRRAMSAQASADRAASRQTQLLAAGLTSQKDIQKAGVGLRKEFNNLPEVKTYRQVNQAYNDLKTAAKNPSAAGDLSIIFGYMKLLDPASVVREGEQASAANATGVPAQIANTYNRVLKGQRLNPQQRADFINQAEGRFRNHENRFKTVAQQYRGYAEDSGVNPSKVINDADLAPSKAQNSKLKFNPATGKLEPM